MLIIHSHEIYNNFDNYLTMIGKNGKLQTNQSNIIERSTDCYDQYTNFVNSKENRKHYRST